MKQLISLAVLSLGLAMGAAHAADDAKKPSTQQTKMGECNKEAGDKKGDERKKFMSECLSAKKPAASDPKKAQQDKMSVCNKTAGDKKGDERKKHMSECLKNKA